MFRRAGDAYDPFLASGAGGPFGGASARYAGLNLPEKTPTRSRRTHMMVADMTTDLDEYLPAGQASLPTSPGVPLVASTPAVPEPTPRTRRALGRTHRASPRIAGAVRTARAASALAQEAAANAKTAAVEPSGQMDVDASRDEFVAAPSSFFERSVRKAQQYVGRVASAFSPFAARGGGRPPTPVRASAVRGAKNPYGHLQAEQVRRSPRLARRYYDEETLTLGLEPRARARHHPAQSLASAAAAAVALPPDSLGLLDLVVVLPLRIIYFVLNALVALLKGVETHALSLLPAPARVRAFAGRWTARGVGAVGSQLGLGLGWGFRALQHPISGRTLAVLVLAAAVYSVATRGLPVSLQSAPSAAGAPSPPKAEQPASPPLQWDSARQRFVLRDDWEQQLLHLRGKDNTLAAQVAALQERVKTEAVAAAQQRRALHELEQGLKTLRSAYADVSQREPSLPSWEEFLAANRDGIGALVRAQLSDVTAAAADVAARVAAEAIAAAGGVSTVAARVDPAGALVDFAHVRSGSLIVRALTSPTVRVSAQTSSTPKHNVAVAMLGLLGFALRDAPGAERVREPHELLLGPGGWASKRAGECWPMAGATGFATLRLPQPVHVTSLALEHLARALAPDGDAGLASAPRNIQVYGVYDAAAWARRRLNETDGPWADNADALRRAASPTFRPDALLLAQGIYEPFGPAAAAPLAPTQPPHIQTLPVGSVAASLLLRFGPVQFVTLRVLGNWGRPEFTCLYRLRVYGEVLPQSATPSRTTAILRDGS